MYLLHELLAMAAEALNHQATDAAKVHAARLAEAGELEVVFVTMEDRLGTELVAWFADANRVPCWDDCDGILRTHRAGWCRVNPEHADLDCGCGEVDYEDWYDHGDEDEAELVTVPVAATYADDEEPF